MKTKIIHPLDQKGNNMENCDIFRTENLHGT